MARGRAKKRNVFLSHSGKDVWVARRIADAIEGAGAEVFLDALDIEVGADFEDEIRAALQTADELVVLMTPWATHRPYVWVELGAIWGREIPIVVLLYGMTPADFQSIPDVPLFIKRRNLLDLNSIDTYLGELKERMEKK